MEESVTRSEAPIMKEFVSEPKKSFLKEIFLPALLIVIVILAGSLTGYLLSGKSTGSAAIRKLTGGAEMVESAKEMGIKDTGTFKDASEGRLEVNDDTNVSEGSHKLIRPGGPSKTAYLTSSAVDLNQFIDKCVEIQGQTFAAQKAGWLMDVGWIRLLDKCPEGL